MWNREKVDQIIGNVALGVMLIVGIGVFLLATLVVTKGLVTGGW